MTVHIEAYDIVDVLMENGPMTPRDVCVHLRLDKGDDAVVDRCRKVMEGTSRFIEDDSGRFHLVAGFNE